MPLPLLYTINKGHSFPLNRCFLFGLFFVRSVFCIFVFVFSPVSLYFIFSCLGLLESLLLRHFSSSLFLIFHTFCAFSSLGFTFFFLPIFFFSSLLSSISNSPTLSRHGNPPVHSTHSLSNKILFHGCVTMGSHCSPCFSPLSLLILTCLRTGFRAFLGDVSADISMLAFPNAAVFVAGRLHCHSQEWKSIAASSSSPLSRVVLHWLQDKVQIQPFFRHFKGNFKGEHFDLPSPPQRILYNHKSCAPFAKFISDTILQRLSTGAITIWGKVGEVDPPHLIMPLTVEPTKPRLCNDNRFLNLWMDDRPFSLDRLDQLPLYVSKDAYQTMCDDKSGYDHILLAPSSRAYLGFQWDGWYFISNTIPFGWKLSAYVYHSTGLLISHYFRSIGIPCSLYIDDRESSLVQSLAPEKLNLVSAQIASFLVCYKLVRLGYCIGLQKSILQPSQSVFYLGFQCDFCLQAFRLLSHKKQKFISLVKAILNSSHVSITDLQRLAGKCIQCLWQCRAPGCSLTRSTWPFPMLPTLLGTSFVGSTAP